MISFYSAFKRFLKQLEMRDAQEVWREPYSLYGERQTSQRDEAD
jgi:hypothetical protein